MISRFLTLCIALLLLARGPIALGAEECEEDTQRYCSGAQWDKRKRFCLVENLSSLQPACQNYMRGTYPELLPGYSQSQLPQEAPPEPTNDCSGWDWHKEACKSREEKQNLSTTENVAASEEEPPSIPTEAGTPLLNSVLY